MSSILLSGDTSGAVTLTVPAVAGTRTATLPAATGTVMVSGNMPAFAAYADAGASLASATQTLVPYNNKTGNSAPAFDTAGCYNNTNATVTLNGISTPAYSFAPNVAGYYQVSANFASFVVIIPPSPVVIIFVANREKHPAYPRFPE